MSRDIDDVVNAAKDPDAAVFIGLGPVAGQEPTAAIFGPMIVPPVGLVEAFRVTPHGAGRAGAGTGDDDDTLLIGGRGEAGFIHNRDVDTGKWAGAGTRFERRIGLARRDDGGPGFGLPPGVDHGHTFGSVTADVGARPLPGLGVDGLTDGADQSD